MGTITIAATYGAGGSVIGPAVAKRLNLPFVDRAIPVDLAEKLHDPLHAALADDSESSSTVGRLLNSALGFTGLFAGVPLGDEQLGVVPDVAQTEKAIRELAGAGGAVILGRAGVFVLKGVPDVLHVRLDGGVEARLQVAMVRGGLDYKTATNKQHATDQARRSYVTHFYPRSGAWDDLRHYHLVIDSTVISTDTCVELITLAAKAVFARSADRQTSRGRA